MHFEEFWSNMTHHLQDSVKMETISMRQKFSATYDSKYEEVIVTPISTKVPRHISRNDFLRVWEKFKEVEGDPYRPGHYQRETRNASYILTLMKTILNNERPE